MWYSVWYMCSHVYRCMFACVLLNARGWYPISYSNTLQVAYLGWVSPWTPSLQICLAEKRQLALGSPLSTSWARRLQVGYHAHVTFVCTLDIWTPVLKFTQQTPYPLVHLTSSLLHILTAQRSHLPLPLNRCRCGNSLSIYPTFLTFYKDPFHRPYNGSWHQCLITKTVPIFNQNPSMEAEIWYGCLWQPWLAQWLASGRKN